MMKVLAIVICVGLLAWAGFSPIRSFLFGVEPPPENEPAGEWVGRLDLLGGYVPTLMGETKGPHTQAVIRLKLQVTDGFMGDYGGSGDMCIIGEAKLGDYTLDESTAPPIGSSC